jgi:hypothetical protein
MIPFFTSKDPTLLFAEFKSGIIFVGDFIFAGDFNAFSSALWDFFL